MDPSTLSHLTPAQLAKIPAMKPPPGVTSNFDDPDSAGPQAIAVISIFLALMVLVVAMRMYGRLVLTKNLGVDDWTTILAAILTSGATGTMIWFFAHNYIGPQPWDIPLTTVMSAKYYQLIFSMTIICWTAAFCAKVSLLLFILRIFPRRASPKTAYAIYFGLAFSIVTCCCLVIYNGVACGPRASNGGRSPPSCTLMVLQNGGKAAAAVNAVLDLYILAITVPPLWGLQMPLPKKIGVVGVLGLGIVACVCSLLTLYYRVVQGPQDGPGPNQIKPLIFGILEPAFAIITASLPCLPPVWLELANKSGSTFRSLLSRVTTTSSFSQSRDEREFGKDGHELHSQSVDDSTRSLKGATSTCLEQELVP